MTANIVLSAENVTLRYGKFVALGDISVAFRSGELTSIIGPNGAGKSSFFNVISGARSPTEGKIVFEGKDITGLPQDAPGSLQRTRPHGRCSTKSDSETPVTGLRQNSRTGSSARSRSPWHWPARRGCS